MRFVPVILLLLCQASGVNTSLNAALAAAPLMSVAPRQAPVPAPVIDGKPLPPPPGCAEGRFAGQMLLNECRPDGFIWWSIYNVYACADGRVFKYHPPVGRARSDPLQKCEFKQEPAAGWLEAPGVRAPDPPRDASSTGGGRSAVPGVPGSTPAAPEAVCQSPQPIEPQHVLRCVDGFRWLVRYDRVRCLDGSIRQSGPPIPVRRIEPLERCDDQTEVQVRVTPEGRIERIEEKPSPYKYYLTPRIQFRIPYQLPELKQQSAAPQQAEKKTLVGLVVPDYKPAAGQSAQISGTVTTEPQKYEGVPGLKVQLIGEVALPQDQNGKPTLEGVVVETGDGKERPANKAFPIGYDTAAQAIPIVVNALRAGKVEPILERTMPVERAATALPDAPPPAPGNYQTPAVLPADAVAHIEGPMDGHCASTQVLFDKTPAHIVAESPNGVFVEPPANTAAGAHDVTLLEETPTGPVNTTFEQVVVTTIGMSAEKTNLLRGEKTKFSVVVAGPEQMPSSAWENDGFINLRLQNKSANIEMKGEKNQVIEKKLKRSDFRGGAYKYEGELQSKQAGGFTIVGELKPEVKRIRGKPISLAR